MTALLLLLALLPLSGSLRTFQEPSLEEMQEIEADLRWQAEAWRESFEAEARDYAAHLPMEAEFAASQAGRASLAEEVGHEDEGGNRTFFFIMSTSAETLNLLKQRVIESVFYHHPNARVRLFATLKAEVGALNELLEPLREKKYDAQALPFDVAGDCLTKLRADRDFEGQKRDIDRFESKLGEYQKTHFWASQVTNLIRLHLLYYTGGVYLDTDAQLVKPFPESYRNVIGKQTLYQANGAVMAFEKGNAYIRECLVEILKNFNPMLWGVNGPMLLTRVWHQRNRSTEELNVLPMPAFYPVFFARARPVFWQLPYNDPESRAAAKLIQEESVVVHYSFHAGVQYSNSTESLGMKLMRQYCVLCERDIFAPPPPRKNRFGW